MSRDSGRTWCRAKAGDVRVIALHPQRSYDLEDQRLSQSFRDTIRLLASAGFAQAAAKVDASMDKQQEEASRFLSRVSKVGACHDGSTMRFRWTFAPSNLRVVPRNLAARVGDLFVGQPGREYEAQATLETGTRLCSAVLLVENSIQEIELEVNDYVVDVDQADARGGQQIGLRATSTGTRPTGKLLVSLPKYDPMENLIGTLPQP